WFLGKQIVHAHATFWIAIQREYAPAVIYSAVKVVRKIRRTRDQIGSAVAVHVAAECRKANPIVRARRVGIVLRIAGTDKGEIRAAVADLEIGLRRALEFIRADVEFEQPAGALHRTRL